MLAEPTVFIVDDDEALRAALARLLESVALRSHSFASSQEFLDGYDPRQPGCLLLDVRMPGMSGLELQETLVARKITLPVIILTGHADVPMAVRALKQGAFDFIEKPFQSQLLLERIQAALAHDAEVRRRLVEHADFHAKLALLTPREREVMGLLVAGQTVKQIAAHLGISHKTIQHHRARILETIDVDSVGALVRQALLAGLR